MEIIINYWYLIVAAIAVLCGAIYAAVRFFKEPSNNQRQKVREWLLYAVIEAEEALGSDAGEKKLKMVYDKFTARFPVLALVFTFNRFSALVDDALAQMRELLTPHGVTVSIDIDHEKIAEQVIGETNN